MDIEHRMRDINLTTILFVIAVFTSRQQYAYGLRCYVCDSTSSSSSCISDPDFSTTCNYKYCTIYRRELAEPTGLVTAFYRACEDNPLYLNTEVQTPFAKTYYRACTSNLCNVGNGVAEVTSSNVEIITAGDNTLVVPGVGVVNDASSLHSGTLLAFVLIIIAYVLVTYYE
ncbi:uncharacterized protein LOC124185200 [Neodiprion fabricii]|uniref:uncharacterized protein LOC124185200 n=1 Tax=Neodiprion fabricii TaxID=2872261 RepID=UPI001ED90677|nr:uncharacterized protein LOC124185200 [Neodiprion fabricii]